MTAEEHDWLEKLTADCLEGKAAGPMFPADKARGVLEERYRGCMRVTGQTPSALAINDPEQYRRWLRGNRAALLRESLRLSGELGPKELRRMWEQEGNRRMGIDIEEFHGAFDAGEAFP